MTTREQYESRRETRHIPLLGNDSGTGRGMSARDDVLRELRAAKGDPVSVWALTLRTGRDEAEVRAAVAGLAAEDRVVECAVLPWWAK